MAHDISGSGIKIMRIIGHITSSYSKTITIKQVYNLFDGEVTYRNCDRILKIIYDHRGLLSNWIIYRKKQNKSGKPWKYYIRIK